MSSPAFAAKSPEAFRTISEVAAELDVPQHVLRFWESRFVQIKPVKRAGGRRFYRPEDVDLLRGIQALLYSDGFTIRGVQKLLKEKGPRNIAAVGRGASLTSDRASDRASDRTPKPVPEPMVVEKIVYVEKPAEAQARKRSAHLRPVPTPAPMSLPFFEGARASGLAPGVGLPVEERAKLGRLLGELERLKRRLRAARR